MAKLSLKVVVAGRTYPLSVNESEEQKVMKAAEDINKAVQLLKENYAVKDMQDLLAMTALQLASREGGKSSASNDNAAADIEEIKNLLEGLSKELDS